VPEHSDNSTLAPPSLSGKEPFSTIAGYLQKTLKPSSLSKNQRKNNDQNAKKHHQSCKIKLPGSHDYGSKIWNRLRKEGHIRAGTKHPWVKSKMILL
jgi:hypothetical protein